MHQPSYLLAALVTVLALHSSVALAHSPLLASTPRDEAQLAEPPQTLDLAFKESVRLVKLKLTSANSQQKLLLPKASESKEHSVPMDPLPAGKHTVSWRAMGSDGHLMKGSFNFTVAP